MLCTFLSRYNRSQTLYDFWAILQVHFDTRSTKSIMLKRSRCVNNICWFGRETERVFCAKKTWSCFQLDPDIQKILSSWDVLSKSLYDLRSSPWRRWFRISRIPKYDYIMTTMSPQNPWKIKVSVLAASKQRLFTTYKPATKTCSNM